MALLQALRSSKTPSLVSLFPTNDCLKTVDASLYYHKVGVILTKEESGEGEIFYAVAIGFDSKISSRPDWFGTACSGRMAFGAIRGGIGWAKGERFFYLFAGVAGGGAFIYSFGFAGWLPLPAMRSSATL